MPNRSQGRISISIHALGGQGGGVLADWLVDVAEHEGYLVQATSVPGVAQRTGATVYYIEVFSAVEAAARGGSPVMALMPMPGDVDLVIASELIEAGRAIARGVVTPDRTMLIASTHRVLAIGEKSAMGDGRVDSDKILLACRQAARKLVSFDMQEIADAHNSVISAVLLGAVAASGVLPFPTMAYEAAIKRSGVGVKSSLKAFAAGFAAQEDKTDRPITSLPILPVKRPSASEIVDYILSTFPQCVQMIILEGARRCADYQDIAYARDYLRYLQPIAALDDGRDDHALTRETARYLALWMSFEDIIRVADLKIRASRFMRLRAEVKAETDQIVNIVEFLHPRYEEFCHTLPKTAGSYLLRSSFWRRRLAGLFSKGRYIRTNHLSGFLLLYFVSRLRRWRRVSLRFSTEHAALTAWLTILREIAAINPELGIELAQCPRLIKGYGDTHARGTSNFNRIMSNLAALRMRSDGAAVLAQLREAALADEEGKALTSALQNAGLHATFP